MIKVYNPASSIDAQYLEDIQAGRHTWFQNNCNFYAASKSFSSTLQIFEIVGFTCNLRLEPNNFSP